MNTFLQKIASNKASGIVTFTLPTYNNNEPTDTLQGYLTDDISFSSGNNFAPLLPTNDILTKIGQVTGTSVMSWLSASKACWKGSEPLTVTLNFYLFTIDQDSKIKEQWFKLFQLTTVHSIDGTSLKVHGGYNIDVAKSNTEDISCNVTELAQEGLISIAVGNKFTLRGMLLTNATPTFSSVETPDGNPLFIKVSASFVSNRPLKDTEVASMFNVNGGVTAKKTAAPENNVDEYYPPTETSGESDQGRNP